MKLRDEYRDQPPPDDPIEFHVWVEANECYACYGTGCEWPDGGIGENEMHKELPDCPECDGTGYTEAARAWV